MAVEKCANCGHGFQWHRRFGGVKDDGRCSVWKHDEDGFAPPVRCGCLKHIPMNYPPVTSEGKARKLKRTEWKRSES
jgi:hypothetical protein